MKPQKEKPAYNVLQNSVYVIRNAWVRDKSVLFVILAQILLTVSISTVGIFLPKTVVELITGGARLSALVGAVLAFTATLMALEAAKRYFDGTAQPRRTELRVGVVTDVLVKTVTTDYANLEAKKFTDMREKVNELTNGNSASTERVYHTFSQLGSSLLGFGVYIALLASVDMRILLVTASTAIIGTGVRIWANRWRHAHEEEQAHWGKRLWYAMNAGAKYDMSKDIRLFGMTDWLREVIRANADLGYGFHRRAGLRQLLADAADAFGTLLREGAAYAYLIWQVLYNGMSVDDFVLMFAAVGGFSGWISGILNECSELQRHSLGYCRLRAFLEYPDKFKREEGESIAPEPGKAYSLELRNVSFRYDGAAENTLENLNLTIAPGEKLAVVGLNGAGKTTLVKLLCGFYDPTEGEVLLNGRDIRAFNRAHYYRLFTAVFQEFNILPVSVAENVAQLDDGLLGDGIALSVRHHLNGDMKRLAGGTLDRDRVRRVLELADLGEKVSSLPKGVDTLLVKSVNLDAAEFSGGETQRLMLARALYRDAPILILDEPTAALDPIAESRMYEKYGELSDGRTSVFISHRLASTRFCDRIILIGDKGIAECGTHDELMRLGGKYAELFEIQSKYYKEGGEVEPR